MRLKNITVLLLTIFFIFFSISLLSTNIRKDKMEVKNDTTYSAESKTKYKGKRKVYRVNKSEEKWKENLTDEQFHILREKGTEQAFTGVYYHNKEEGIYYCAACGNELFSSEEKYDSGSGWPSFYAPKSENDINEIIEVSFGMVRTEIVCSQCGSHLGHVFNDGPEPSGLRYCVNSISLKFEKNK